MNHRRAPLVSVVVPCFNAEAFVEGAVRSVLDQDYGNVEVVVVDDASEDGTARVIAALGPRVRMVTLLANAGVGPARNAGFAAARGELVVLLDADDALEPGCVSALVATALDEPDARFVIPHVDIVDRNGVVIQRLPPDPYRIELHEVLALQIPQVAGTLVRKPLADPPVTFRCHSVPDDRFGAYGDWVFWIDAASLGLPAAHAPHAAARYVQQNPASLSSDIRLRWVSGLEVLEYGRRVALRVHGDCEGCRGALAAGRRAVIDYCLKSDAALMFGSGVGMEQRVSALARLAQRRDPASVLLIARTAGWKVRDALRDKLRAERA